MCTFADMESTPAGFRAAIKTDFGIDAEKGPEHRALTARLVSAWRAASTRHEAREKEEAHQRAQGLPKTMLANQHLELREAFVKVHGEVKDIEVPHPDYIELKVDELEKGELLPESLMSVVVRRPGEELDTGAIKFAHDGTMRVAKRRTQGDLPADTEAFRAKMTIMANAWEMIRLRYPSKPVLKELEPKHWGQYVKWILGEDVMYATIAAPSGGSSTGRCGCRSSSSSKTPGRRCAG